MWTVLQNVVLFASVLGAGAVPSYVRQSAGDPSAPIVDVGYSQFQGALDNTTNVTSFLGIRYAAAPIGDLRWRAPVAPNATTGVQQATTEPNECFQAGDGNGTGDPFRTGSLAKRAVVQDEDCLFLNVFTPGALDPSQSLPVVVWIHGGGYVAGSASQFTGQDLVREADFGVVAVIIQYRLGVLGFLPGSEVQQDGALNAGLLDQRFALQWVQDHVAAFGGDPTKVTIWGESAGAGSVLQHVIADGGQTDPPFFRAAMSSSLFVPFQYVFNDTIPEALFSMVATQANCSATSDVMSCLRSTDATTLQTVNTNIELSAFFGTFTFVPVIDGTVILERPIEALINKRVNGEMLLAVTNSFEGAPFTRASDATNLTQYVTNLFPELDADHIQQVVDIYTADTELATTDDDAIAIMGENVFICPTYIMLNAFEGKAFKGEFAVPFATHGADVAYYFPTSNPPAFNNSDFITAFSQSFLSMVAFLDTNEKFVPDIKPEWPLFSEGMMQMLFNRTDAGEPLVELIPTDPALLERCSFWQNISALTHQ